MLYLVVGLLIGCSVSTVISEDVRLVELEPDEAAKLINQKEQTLRYAPKIQSNVPTVRIIGDHPENVVEDIYLANQYHGQDGLGAYLYGYAVPDISKTEKKERSGSLKGAYNYISGNGKEIKVEYWDDGNGFHQVDNVDKIQPQQVEDSPEVKAAKEEHLRIWHEQAERNSRAPADPYASQYDQPQQPIQNQYQQYQGQVSYQPNSGAGRTQGSQPSGVSRPYQQGAPNSIEYTGQYSNNQQSVLPTSQQGSAARTSDSRQSLRKPEEEEEETGPPKGFFYSFDYPVGLIVGREGKNLEAYYSENKNAFDQQLRGEGPRPVGSSNSYHASA